jgi:metallo-beta-lactamase class B
MHLRRRKAAGTDFRAPARLCIMPDAPTGGGRRSAPSRARHLVCEPARMFDNLYWVGTKIHSAWALQTSDGIYPDRRCTIMPWGGNRAGLQKLGLNPSTIKYVIITTPMAIATKSASCLQDRYGANVVMGRPDWDLIEKDIQYSGRRAQRVIGTDQKITLGDSVTLVQPRGHTVGTLSMIFTVDRDRLTAWPFRRQQFLDAARYDTYRLQKNGEAAKPLVPPS